MYILSRHYTGTPKRADACPNIAPPYYDQGKTNYRRRLSCQTLSEYSIIIYANKYC